MVSLDAECQPTKYCPVGKTDSRWTGMFGVLSDFVNYCITDLLIIQLHFYRYCSCDFQTVRCYRTLAGKNLYSFFSRISQSIAKFPMCRIIRSKQPYSWHLNHKQHITVITISHCLDEFFNMLYSPIGGCVWKRSYTVIFKCYSFDLNKTFFTVFVLNIEIKTRITIYFFRTNYRKLRHTGQFYTAVFQSLSCDFIWSLGVHIYQ